MNLKQTFTSHLIDDLQALERLENEGLFESGVTRLGAEQEFCLINYQLRPAMLAMEMLDALDDEQFTTELAKFNLEANLNPLVLQNGAFSQLENNLIRMLTKANRKAHALGAKIILTGILPSIKSSDLTIDNMTPKDRYHALNEAMRNARGNDFTFNITGIDELITKHDSVLFESCNTSFQIHYQLNPQKVSESYNWALAIAAPVLSACTNSPVFLGKRLWKETRIALLHQSSDTRQSHNHLRDEIPRVNFGLGWKTKGAAEIFQEAVSRYKILMPLEVDEVSTEVLAKGKIPKLKALSIHNSTIYNWNRLCYGVTEGVPHLRIENRYIPSGPTIVDEVANSAFWIGLMHGMPEYASTIHDHLRFDDAKSNFMHAAKSGLQCQFRWLDDSVIPAHDLIINELLPIAQSGLENAGIDKVEIDKYLGIIKKRVESNKTGSNWILDSYTDLRNEGPEEQALIALTEGIYQRQKMGNPVHEWKPLQRKEGGGWKSKYAKVEQIMSRNLLTVHEDDLLELAKNMMIWSNIHHLPVEDANGGIVGLITSDRILSFLGQAKKHDFSFTVGQAMIEKPLTTTPETSTIDAYRLMKEKEIGSLPVLQNEKLVGIITLNDFIKLFEILMEELG